MNEDLPAESLILDSLPHQILILDENHCIRFANRAVREAFGSPDEPLAGGYCPWLMHGCDEPIECCPLEEAKKTGAAVEKEIRAPDSGRWFRATVYPIGDADGEGPRLYLHMSRDITGEKQSEEMAARSTQALRERSKKDLFMSRTSRKLSRIQPSNLDRGFEDILALMGDFAGVDRSYIFLFHEEEPLMSNTHEWCASGIEPQKDNLQDIPLDATPWWTEKMRRKEAILVADLDELPAAASMERDILEAQDIRSLLVVPLLSDDRAVGFMGFDSVRKRKDWKVEDVAFLQMIAAILVQALAQRKADQALRRQEEQLRMAQKMESLGRLAGGVTHDFNNLLTVILGYSELARERAGRDEVLRGQVEEIRKAGRMAASLTQRLLAFTRNQPVQPRVLELNRAVRSVETLLERTLGEDLDLRLHLPERPLHLFVDPSQIEQIIMNISLNARDAMPGGGTLSISTRQAIIDEAFCAANPVARAGEYAVLSFQDTGAGMDPETQQKIFEPFFTTKAEGKGTGFGLSIVFGIVKQNRGYIDVTSAPGQGTTFDIYLPLADRKAEAVDGPDEARPPANGRGTVLVVEDRSVKQKCVGKTGLILASRAASRPGENGPL